MPDVTLTFRLDEDVTPDHLAARVAQACAKYYALRPGEGVLLPSNPATVLLVTDQPVDLTSLIGGTD